MSTFILTGLPILAIGLFFIALFLRNKDKNYLIPGGVMMMAGLVNLVVGIMVS
ncbi:hypothetical protein ACFL9S_06005 [Erwinia sp. AnSW2-5]|uniref:hypothetical protein n=1 Tax=Erwinia sp. AnSW2-5 TaxID=3367692 RepID=UPI00385DED3C